MVDLNRVRVQMAVEQQRGERWVAEARGEVGGGRKGRTGRWRKDLDRGEEWRRGGIWIGGASEGKKGGGGWKEIYPENIARVSGLVWMG